MTIDGHKIERRWRRRLDNWRLWMVIFGFALGAVLVWELTIQIGQSRDESAHHTQIIDNAKSQYVACLKSIPTLAKINGYLDGQRAIAESLVENATANLKSTDPKDPIYKTRVKNLARLEHAKAQSRGVRFPVPTKHDCLLLRRSLLAQR